MSRQVTRYSSDKELAEVYESQPQDVTSSQPPIPDRSSYQSEKPYEDAIKHWQEDNDAWCKNHAELQVVTGLKNVSGTWVEQLVRNPHYAPQLPDATAGKTKASNSRIRLRHFTLSTQLDAEHFHGWSADELKALAVARDTGDIEPMSRVMYARLDATDAEIESFYAVLHDRDKRRVLDKTSSPVSVSYETKAPHVHLLVSFAPTGKGRTYGLSLPNIAKALGLEENIVQKLRNRRDAYDSMLAYLTHAKDSFKFQYAVSDVLTLAGKPYEEIEHDRAWDWATQGAKRAAKQAIYDADYVAKLCAYGQLKREDVLDMNGEWFPTFASSPAAKRKILDGLDTYGRVRSLQNAQALKRQEYRKTSAYVTGLAGTGKSTMVNMTCALLERFYKWDAAKLGSEHSSDQYAGQDVIVLDDAGPNSMTAPAFTNLTDPVNSYPLDARYHSKEDVAPRSIIMLSNIDFMNFFFRTRNAGDKQESLDKFIRRFERYFIFSDPKECGAYFIDVMKPEQVDAYTWKGDQIYSKDTGKYEEIEVVGLHRKFVRMEKDTFHSLPSAVKILFRAIEANQLDGRPRIPDEELDAAVAELMEEFVRPAVDAGNLPACVMLPEGAPEKFTGDYDVFIDNVMARVEQQYAAVFPPYYRDRAHLGDARRALTDDDDEGALNRARWVDLGMPVDAEVTLSEYPVESDVFVKREQQGLRLRVTKVLHFEQTVSNVIDTTIAPTESTLEQTSKPTLPALPVSLIPPLAPAPLPAQQKEA